MNPASVTFNQDIEDFKLDVKRLQALGILVNELITNIRKYAFSGQGEQIITISLKLVSGRVILIIQDNGNGFPESFNFETSKSFGITLVKALTAQLYGIITVEQEKGVKYTVEFDL